MKPNFRVKVMKYAHNLAKSTKNAWAVCLMKAWELYRIYKRMKQGIVKFAYMKTDGSIRYAFGTILDKPINNSVKRITKPSYKTFTYWDVEKSEVRSFKIENLIVVY